MKKFFNVVIHPNYGECPLWEGDEANCNECKYCHYIGTDCGEYYVECEMEDE